MNHDEIAALIAPHRRPGTFVERRRFSLDRDRAIAKMRAFSLADPTTAILELIQAANLTGAKALAIDTQDTELSIAWTGGTSIPPEILANLLDALFEDQRDVERRGYHQVAVGVNAMLQLEPTSMRVESGDGTLEGSSWLSLDADVLTQSGPSEQAVEGTALLVRFASAREARQACNASIIAHRAALSRATISIDGYTANRMCPVTLQMSENAERFEVIELPGVRGSLCVGPGIHTTTFAIGGVHITSKSIFGGRVGGVVIDDRLRKTADMSDIVEDDRFLQLLEDLEPMVVRLIGSGAPPAWSDPEGSRPSETLSELPARIPQVAPRAPLMRHVLARLPPDEPIFWVLPESSSSLIEACDPLTLPFRVLRLTPEQATLALEDAPQLVQLQSPADIGFVQRIAERSQRWISTEIRGEALSRALGSPTEGVLTVRLHTEGADPKWDASGRADGLPTLVMIDDKPRHLLRLPSRIPHVSAILALFKDELKRLSSEVVLTSLSTAIRDVLPSLLRRALAGGGQSVEVARHLLETFASPVVRRGAEGRLHLQAHLPSAWGEDHETLLDLPLALTRAGPLTLRRLIQVQGTRRVFDLLDPGEALPLRPLEDRFGLGHIRNPGSARDPLFMFGHRNGRWQPFHAESELPSFDEAYVLEAQVEPTKAPEGWVEHPTSIPFLTHWAQSGSLPDPDHGKHRLALHLDERLRVQPPEGATILVTVRCELARLGFATDALRLVDQGGHVVSLSEAMSEGRHRFALRGGPRVERDRLIVLPFLALRALDQLSHNRGAGPLPMADAQLLGGGSLLGSPRWLVRREVDSDGLTGFLALAFDPLVRSGVMVDTSHSLHLLTAPCLGAACTGQIRLKGRNNLHPLQLQRLRSTTRMLYRDLLPLLDETGPRGEAARRDAARFVLSQDDPLDGFTENLAASISLPKHDLTLKGWLDLHPEDRPALPDSWRVTTDDTPSSTKPSDLLSSLVEPISHYLSLQLKEPLRFHPEAHARKTFYARDIGTRTVKLLVPATQLTRLETTEDPHTQRFVMRLRALDTIIQDLGLTIDRAEAAISLLSTEGDSR
ncbi:MAG: hypothetical protein EA397_19625 [Deltaproteobacteria bacterium]|nr:MAG: hypothetical protein EA397_19625 [Deltaproteobacteria bacterium]